MEKAKWVRALSSDEKRLLWLPVANIARLELDRLPKSRSPAQDWAIWAWPLAGNEAYYISNDGMKATSYKMLEEAENAVKELIANLG